MEMSREDRLIVVLIMAIGTISYLLIAYDSLDILFTSQKWITDVIVTVVLFPLLLYHRHRIIKKMKKQPGKALFELHYNPKSKRYFAWTRNSK